jgi:hypothetical protein
MLQSLKRFVYGIGVISLDPGDVSSNFSCRILCIDPVPLVARVLGIAQPRKTAGLMTQKLGQQIKPLAPENLRALGIASDVPAGPRDTID